MKGVYTIECAEELVNIFSRIGIPQEILSDRGSQFVSDLMREISRLLSVPIFPVWHDLPMLHRDQINVAGIRIRQET